MPSGIQNWSTTAASNATADSAINMSEGMAPSAVNDGIRAQMAVLAKWRDDIAGGLTTGGTSTAYTLTTSTIFTTLALLSGQTLTVRFNATNGASPTLNVDSLGAKAIQTASGTAVPTGALLANSIHRVTYDNSIPAFLLHDRPAAFGALAAGALTLSDILRGADGSVSAPAVSFSADTDTGFYRIGANNFGAACNGAKVLDIGTGGLGVTGALTSSGALTAASAALTSASTVGGSQILVRSDVADQAAQEAASSITNYTSPGRQQYHPSACKAWAYITGTPPTTVSAGYNVASVTKDGGGTFTVTLTTAMSSANWAGIAIAAGVSRRFVTATAQTASTITFIFDTAGGGASDPVAFSFFAFGDQ